MKVISHIKVIILNLVLLIIAFPPCHVFSQNSVKLSEDDLNNNVYYLLKEYGKILHKKNWKVIIENNQLRAYNFSNNYHALKAQIMAEYNSGYTIFSVSLYINGEKQQREFKTTSENLPIDSIRTKNTILSFMLIPIISKNKSKNIQKVFFPSISIGYNRTHDRIEFYPQYKQGSIYFSGELVYDPSKNSKEKEIPLSIGDYLSFVIYAAYDSEVRENYSNIDILLLGKHKYKTSNSSETRILYGFFNGMEYFRPGFSDTTVRWDHQIYKKQPHIQYYIYRALSWGYIRSVKSSGIYTTSIMAGFGPSINSSLNCSFIIKLTCSVVSISFVTPIPSGLNIYLKLFKVYVPLNSAQSNSKSIQRHLPSFWSRQNLRS